MSAGASVLSVACWLLAWTIGGQAQSSDTVDPQLAQFDPRSIIHAASPAQAEQVRKKLIKFIWHADDLPGSRAREFDTHSPSPITVESSNLGAVQPLQYSMEFGVTVYPYLFEAAQSGHCLFIYHSGHSEPISPNVTTSLLGRVMGAGCDILYLAMPLTHHNPRPVVQTTMGPVRLATHSSLSLLASDKLNPLKFFLDPILASVNYAEARRGPYQFVFMAGLSGGGWATTVYSAVDQRITASFPVAGSLPLALRSFVDKDLGDWEEYASGLTGIASYLDLYLLATYPMRTQEQLLTVNDPCCFGDRVSHLYESTVADIAHAWGGHFSVRLDEIKRVHDVTPSHVESILATVAELSGLKMPPAPPGECADVRDSDVVLKGPFAHVAGYAYLVLTPDLLDLSDTNDHPDRSPLRLCENKTLLGPSHSAHAAIEKDGAGSYSHYGTGIVFSSSDLTDPNTNGRQYRIIFPK